MPDFRYRLGVYRKSGSRWRPLLAGTNPAGWRSYPLGPTPSLIAAQSSVEWNERGVVTGTNLFARSIGSSIGVAVFGEVANAIYTSGHGTATDPRTVVSASAAVFLAVLASAILTVIAVIAMPATQDRSTAAGAAARTNAASSQD